MTECRRAGCTHSHLKGPRDHGYCCNACRCYGGQHTPNCTGFDNAQIGFRIPEHWKRSDDIMSHINWYMRRFDIWMDDNTKAAWLQLQNWACFAVNRDRELRIHVRPQNDTGPHRLIDVTTYHLDGYDGTKKSGIHFEIQAKLLSQQDCARAMFQALTGIECGGLADFTFVCRHATHRSVGMACLVATLFYHRAKIVFYTRRTNADAKAYMIKT